MNPLSDNLIYNPFVRIVNFCLLLVLLIAVIMILYPTFIIDLGNTLLTLPTYLGSFIKTLKLSCYTSFLIIMNLFYLLISYYLIYITTLILTNNKTFTFSSKLPLFLTEDFKKDSFSTDKFESFNDLYKQTILFTNTSADQKSFNFSFENSFYKVFLHNLNVRRPTLETNSLLILNPSNYLNLEDVNVLQNQNLNTTYLPQNTLLNDPKNLSTVFYISDTSFKKLNLLSNIPELVNINTNMKTQSDLINLLRWSYRYSNLHRRTMFNSHKITESKKLLSSGFFDINLTNESLWFSDKFGKESGNLSSRKNVKYNELGNKI